MAEDALSLPAVQPGVGECWRCIRHAKGAATLASASSRCRPVNRLRAPCCWKHVPHAWHQEHAHTHYYSCSSALCFPPSQEFSKIERIVGGSANAE